MNSIRVIKKLLGSWFSHPWYPIAFGAYPALYLLSVNTGQIQAEAGIRALAASVIFAGVLFFIMRLAMCNTHRAAFLTALWLILFFSYGHVLNLLNEKYPDYEFDRGMSIGWIGLFGLSLVWATRRRLNFTASAPGLNTIGLGLLVLSLWQINSGSGIRSAHALGAENAPVQLDLAKPENPPDVYYFILDSYGRADNLYEAYGFDNSGFLEALKERGFYVAECSQSNYVRTEISLASSLNMMYLQDLDDDFKPDSISRHTLWDSLQHSAVRYNFESMGYTTVNFASGYAWLELGDADLFLSPPPFSSGLTEFEGLFLRTTLARYIQDWGWVDADAVMGQSFRDRFNNIFDNMDELARMPEPTFVYAHVISPHPPFVFDPDGNPTHPSDFWNENHQYPPDLYARGYQNQLAFLNKKMLEAVDTILAESKTPPIIVIQGDHGPWLQPKNKRMWILNAYYLPGHTDKLYPAITPVNTFRLVFDAYFGGKYDMLEDVSYFSPVPKLYEFSEIPNTCK
jgi:hypothetical protein